MTWLNSFFPTKVSLLFIFKPWAEQKNTRSYLTLTSPSQNICLFAVIDVYSVLEFPICEKKMFLTAHVTCYADVGATFQT